MSLTKLTANLNNHQSLPDEPDNALYTPEDLKIYFDKAPNDIKDYINNILIPQLESTTVVSGAEHIGSRTIPGITGNTVWEQISSLLSIAQQAQSGTILPGSVTDTMLSNATGQIKSTVSTLNTAVSDMSKAVMASGTGTVINLTIPSITAYTPLQKLTFVAIGNNNGALTTININGLGAKPLYKLNTTTSPTLIEYKTYTIILKSDGLSFFLDASAEGTATAADVLAGKTFSNDIDTGLVGTAVVVPTNNLTPGNIVLWGNGSTTFSNDTSFVSAFSKQVNFSGTIRVNFRISKPNGVLNNTTAQAQIYKNGIPVGSTKSFTTTIGDYQSSQNFYEDITVINGDTIQIYAKGRLSLESGYYWALESIYFSVAQAWL
jgi:hypothetical protein